MVGGEEGSAPHYRTTVAEEKAMEDADDRRSATEAAPWMALSRGAGREELEYFETHYY